MANTSRGIWYVDPGTEVSLAQITEDVATSVDNALGVIEADLNAIPVIDSGKVSITTAGRVRASQTVTFSKTFSSAPVVVATGHRNAPNFLMTTVAETTASEFEIWIYVDQSSTSTNEINWIAVGV